MAPWTVVIPVKALASAKTRLAGEVDAPADLALAFLRDVLAATVATPAVARVVVVTGDPTVGEAAESLGAVVVDDTAQPGINAAARHGARFGQRGSGTAVVVSDLPCLRAESLTLVLGAAGLHPRSFLPDLDGTGTTMWFCGPGEPVDPRFGAASRAAHADAGDVDLVTAHPELVAALETARLDIDTADALDRAITLGVGPSTASALALRRP